MNEKISVEKFEYEINLAQRFLKKHQDDKELFEFLKKVKASNSIHSQKWSKIFDYMYDHYKKECMETSIVTGLGYLCE